MDIDRSAPNTIHTDPLMASMSQLQGPCIGCTECTGFCAALLEALTLPDMILDPRRKDG